MKAPGIIDQRTGISIALAGVLGTALFTAGNYMGKVDALERMNIPTQLSMIQADLAVIKLRLGVPGPHSTAEQTSTAATATERQPTRWPTAPRRTVVLPE